MLTVGNADTIHAAVVVWVVDSDNGDEVLLLVVNEFVDVSLLGAFLLVVTIQWRVVVPRNNHLFTITLFQEWFVIFRRRNPQAVAKAKVTATAATTTTTMVSEGSPILLPLLLVVLVAIVVLLLLVVFRRSVVMVASEGSEMTPDMIRTGTSVITFS